MFRLLAAHPGPSITATAAAALAGVGLDRTRTLLRELVLANLLTEHADSSYTLNDLLRAYAAEQTGKTGDAADASRGPAMRRKLDHTWSPVRP
jgi:hypothetical protein